MCRAGTSCVAAPVLAEVVAVMTKPGNPNSATSRSPTHAPMEHAPARLAAAADVASSVTPAMVRSGGHRTVSELLTPAAADAPLKAVAERLVRSTTMPASEAAAADRGAFRESRTVLADTTALV